MVKVHEEQCELFIEQEIEEGKKQGKSNYKIAKEISQWVEKIFGRKIKPDTIERRIERQEENRNIVPSEITTSNDSGIQENQSPLTEIKAPRQHRPTGEPKGGEREGAGRPPKFSVVKPKKEDELPKIYVRNEEAKHPTFNITNDNIKWAAFTWNPVTGCKHGCKYCYARDIANRFIEFKFEPHLYESRLEAPKNTKIPTENLPGNHNVFVCSMADLFGEWVPQEWIDKVFSAIKEAPKWWNFILLTKNPERYLTLDFPDKCYIGATTDTQERMDRTIKVFKKLRDKVDNKLFVSCEPLMGEIETELKCIDWLIIGGRSATSGMQAGQPDALWVKKLIEQSLKYDIPLYLKENLERIQEFPKKK